MYSAHRWTGCRAALASVLMLALPAVSTHAQTAPAAADWQTVRVTLNAQNQSLADIAASLSPQIGRGLLIDGDPQPAQATLVLKGDARTALDKVADTFDYAWTSTRGGILVLNTRFNRPDSRPQANLPELRAATADVLMALDRVPRGLKASESETYLQALGRTFTPAQMQTLRTGAPLGCSALFPQQRDLVEQALLCRYFSGARVAWEQLQTRLDNMTDASLTAKRRDMAAESTSPMSSDLDLILRVKSRSGTPLETARLPAAVEADGGGGNPYRESPAPTGLVRDIAPNFGDARLALKVHLPSGPTTVGALATALAEQTGLAIEASSALKTHRLIAQLDGLPAREIMKALADLGDWSWDQATPRRFVLMRHALDAPSHPLDATMLAQAALPRDFRNYLGLLFPAASASDSTPHVAIRTRASAGDLYNRQIDGLLATLPPGVLKGDSVAYSQLKPSQQDQLLIALVAYAIVQTRPMAGNREFLKEMDPANLAITARPTVRGVTVNLQEAPAAPPPTADGVGSFN